MSSTGNAERQLSAISSQQMPIALTFGSPLRLHRKRADVRFLSALLRRAVRNDTFIRVNYSSAEFLGFIISALNFPGGRMNRILAVLSCIFALLAAAHGQGGSVSKAAPIFIH